ncbi:GNAT family N-acetyltransferase [Nonomuraea sp. NPDC050786]|uniref:GNAT family N-acetyltransferase n=1 Tax=Nonomuraea sp. NPDC050786 TaxID=3154840 RepID=UPI0033F16A05
MSVELLRVELGVIWRLDARGRLPGPEDLVIGVAADGMTAAVSGRLPGPLAARLLDLVAKGVPSPPGHPPDVLARCRELLGDEQAVSGGPSYLVRQPTRFDVPAEVLRSEDPAHAERVRPLRPSHWTPGEWDELVGRGEGAPWAMIVEDGQVAAICHSARLTPQGAEAGTWTSPAFRGRGYAAATTAAWAGLLPDIPLFYSTSADNRSSQRVAARLGLRPVGWLWKLTP